MFIKLLAVLITVLALAAPVQAAALKIAVIAPEGDALGLLGSQVRQGALLGAAEKADIVPIKEDCSEKSGAALAEKIKQSGAVAAIGFLCVDSLDGLLEPLAAADIAVITISIRATIPMEDALKKKWPLFRLAPAPLAERQMIAGSIQKYWSDQPFALLDDGTISSRDTTEWVRNTLETQGMKATFLDTFRPAQETQTQLMRRLSKAGVTHVFAAADRSDMSVMSRDAASAGLNLTFMGGDPLNAVDQDVPLTTGVLAVTLPEWSSLAAAKPAVEALQKEGKAAEGYVLPASAAVSVVIEAAEIASGSGATIAEAMIDTPFSTAIGEIRFTEQHELANNPFELMRWDGKTFSETVTVP